MRAKNKSLSKFELEALVMAAQLLEFFRETLGLGKEGDLRWETVRIRTKVIPDRENPRNKDFSQDRVSLSISVTNDYDPSDITHRILVWCVFDGSLEDIFLTKQGTKRISISPYEKPGGIRAFNWRQGQQEGEGFIETWAWSRNAAFK